jgi:hypothetical protein
MVFVSWALAAVFIVAATCLAYGYSNGTDLEDALARSMAGTFGGFAMAGDLTGMADLFGRVNKRR